MVCQMVSFVMRKLSIGWYELMTFFEKWLVYHHGLMIPIVQQNHRVTNNYNSSQNYQNLETECRCLAKEKAMMAKTNEINLFRTHS